MEVVEIFSQTYLGWHLSQWICWKWSDQMSATKAEHGNGTTSIFKALKAELFWPYLYCIIVADVLFFLICGSHHCRLHMLFCNALYACHKFMISNISSSAFCVLMTRVVPCSATMALIWLRDANDGGCLGEIIANKSVLCLKEGSNHYLAALYCTVQLTLSFWWALPVF